MATTLLPTLPPELRTEIYSYLSTQATPTTHGLPLKPKTYTSAHTTLQLAACHTGSTSLLCPSFSESAEYTTWLLNNGLHIKIGLHFHGRMQTFVQADWDRKVAVHLRKVGRMYPFLKKVVEYDVVVRWEPKDGGGFRGKRVAGAVVAGLVRGVTSVLGSEELKGKRGCVDVKVRLAHGVGVEMAVMGMRFGVAEVLAGRNGFRRGRVEVCLEGRVRALPVEVGKQFLACAVEREERELLVLEKDAVVWGGEEGQVLIREEWEDGKVVCGGGEEPEEIVLARLKQCLR